MSRLVERKSVQNIKAAKKYVDSMTPEVWDVLEEVIRRASGAAGAPTLHRLGIQVRAGARRRQGDPSAPARLPRVQRRLRRRPDGRAPAAFRRGAGRGADSDAVVEQHPLAGTGRLPATPTQDMVLGIYVLTYSDKDLAKMDATGKGSWGGLIPADVVQLAVEWAARSRLARRSSSAFGGELRTTTPRPRDLQPAAHRSGSATLSATRQDGVDDLASRTTRSRSRTWTATRLRSDRYGAHTLCAGARHDQVARLQYSDHGRRDDHRRTTSSSRRRRKRSSAVREARRGSPWGSTTAA